MNDVLQALNHFRKAYFGLEPLEEMPKGVKCDEDGCPIANAIPSDWKVSSTFIYHERFDGEDVLSLPQTLARFAQDFDDGKYPELVES